MAEIRYAVSGDEVFWLGLDKHISAAELERKIRDRQCYIILDNNIPVGLLRYNLFWDNIPFCTMIYLKQGFRKMGHGSRLIGFWEDDMRAAGFGMVMTSTQSDENGQHFYRKLGYKDSGGLLIDIKGYEQPMEIFFTKAL